MYAIIKGSIEDGSFNIVCDPATGKPIVFDDMLEAETWAEQYGFAGPDVRVEEVDPEKLEMLDQN